MSLEVIRYANQYRNSISELPGGHENRFSATLVCRNQMLGLGLKNILSSSSFATSAISSYEQVPTVLASPASTNLFILEGCGAQSDTVQLIQSIRERYPQARIVIVADQFSLDDIKAGLELGVGGFCLTSSSPDVLIKSLELVMLHEVVLPSAFIQTALENRAKKPGIEARQGASGSRTLDSRAQALSTREAQILECLMQGAPNKVIARHLDVAEATVKVHVKAILKKIGAANRTQAAMWATDHLPARPESRTSL